MNLTALPAFADNCHWMIDAGSLGVLVDPGRPGPVAEALDAGRLSLAAILVTRDDAEICAALRAADRSDAASDIPAAVRTWKSAFR